MANELNLNVPTEATPSDYSGVFNMPTQATPTNAIPMQISEDIVAVVNDLKQSVYNKQDKLNENQLANINSNHSNYLTEHQDISGKQDKLTAGENITIVGNVISASGGGGTVNAYTKAETDTLLETKADASTTYTKTEVDSIKSELNGDIANRITIAQGSENIGKYLTVAENGNVSPTELALKTINNESILGSGNIAISVGGETWVDLGSGTLEEEANIISVACNNGLKKIELIVTAPSNTTVNIMRMTYQKSGWSWFNSDNSYWASDADFSYLFVKWERVYEKENLTTFVVSTGANHISTNTILVKGSISDFNFELLQKIGVRNNSKFPVGTTFKARGVY